MRMSCNGCRVLRKGCSEDCTIRPCLDWIKNPEAQGNATVFLAKFYGRAGLLNLIAVGPDHLRPAIFRSLLYEACGRMVNPIYGSVGLLSSGNWPLCQAAVDAILNGTPIVQLQSNGSGEFPAPPLKSFDIRHVAKPNDHNHHLLKTTRTRFKRVKNEKSAQNFNQSELNYKSSKDQLSNGHEDGSVVSGETVTAPVGGALELDLTLTLGSNQELSA